MSENKASTPPVDAPTATIVSRKDDPTGAALVGVTDPL
jgi:hypothetical protein